jgi:hypothetical protein
MRDAFGVERTDIAKYRLPVFHGTTKAGAKAIKHGKFVSSVGRKRKGVEAVAAQPHTDFRPEGIYTTPKRDMATMYSRSGRSPDKRGMRAASQKVMSKPYKPVGRVLEFDAKGKHPLYTDKSFGEIVFNPTELGKPRKTHKVRFAAKAKADGKKYAVVTEGSKAMAFPRKKFEKVTAEVGNAFGKPKKKMKKAFKKIEPVGEKMERKAPYIKFKDGQIKEESPNIHPKLRKKMLKQAVVRGKYVKQGSSKKEKQVLRSANQASPLFDETMTDAFGVGRTAMSKGLPSALKGAKGMETIQRAVQRDPVAAKKAVRSLRKIRTRSWDETADMERGLQTVDRNQGREAAYMLSRRIRSDRGRTAATAKKKTDIRLVNRDYGKGARAWEKNHGFEKPKEPNVPNRMQARLNEKYYEGKVRLTFKRDPEGNPTGYESIRSRTPEQWEIPLTQSERRDRYYARMGSNTK